MIQSNLYRNIKPYGVKVTNLRKYNESAKIAREKITEIFNLFPLLKKEIIGDGNYGKDYVDNLTYVLVTG